MTFSTAEELEKLAPLTIISAVNYPKRVAVRAHNGLWTITGSQYSYTANELVIHLGDWILVRAATVARRKL